MFANERRIKILELLNERPSVTVSELTETFDVSIETVRRDLEYLEEQSSLKRVHGGAISLRKMQNYVQLSARTSAHKAEKKQLSLAAASLIQEGDLIAIDTGSTALELAAVICDCFRELTVVTNSLEVFHILSAKEGFRILLTGGQFLKKEMAFYGHLAEDMLRSLHISKYFLTPAAISIQFGISDYIHELIPMQRSLLEISDQVYVLADSSKFETNAACRICRLNPLYTYLTDTLLSQEICDAYAEQSLMLRLC